MSVKRYEASYCGASDDGHVECEMPYLKDRIAALSALCQQQNEALEFIQFGFNHVRCPMCSGWNMGPDGGETDFKHTANCGVGTVLNSYAALFPKTGGANG